MQTYEQFIGQFAVMDDRIADRLFKVIEKTMTTDDGMMLFIRKDATVKVRLETTLIGALCDRISDEAASKLSERLKLFGWELSIVSQGASKWIELTKLESEAT